VVLEVDKDKLKKGVIIDHTETFDTGKIIYLPEIPELDPNTWDDIDIKTIFKKDTKRAYFTNPIRIPKWLFDWLDIFNTIYGRKVKTCYIRDSIADKPKYNRVLRKILSKEALDDRDIEFINRVMQEKV
jgi:hypothetical protein